MGASQIAALVLGIAGVAAVRPLWRWDGKYTVTDIVGDKVLGKREKESRIPPHACAVATAIAACALLAAAPSEDLARTVLATAFCGVIGLSFVFMGANIWLNLDRDAAQIDRVRKRDGTESNLVGTALQEGPIEAGMQGISSLFSTRWLLRYSAIAGLTFGLAVLVLAVTVALNESDMPAGVESGAEVYGVVVDVLELVGYGALTLIMLGVLIWALLTNEPGAVGGALLFLALYAVSIGVGLWLGLLDGWIDIIEYVF